MAAEQTMWAVGERERRLRISQEVQQLRTMSKSLRQGAMRSFMERLSPRPREITQTEAPVKPTFIAA